MIQLSLRFVNTEQQLQADDQFCFGRKRFGGLDGFLHDLFSLVVLLLLN
jgi:hypothetical protein